MPNGLTARLLDRATELGAASVGVAGADLFEQELLTLREQKLTGRSGPLHFTYDDPESATDIRRSFPWAKRILVVGWDYLEGGAAPAESGAVVGRFATSDHYRELTRITGALADDLEENGFRAEILIDDNRLVDRAAAVRAGVGWSGKSTMVLTPGHGPWMLLGSVVTDAPLEASTPMVRDCGTCVACYPACPTNALSDQGLDARRCLSTWLQTRGSIPHWIRPHLGRRIYGCDECLTACPPGKRALETSQPQPLDLPFTDLLALSDAGLIDRFSWWYVPIRDGRYLRRNILVAAGNSGEDAAWNPITEHLEHPSSMIRGVAAWATARSSPNEAKETVRRRLDVETVPETREELMLALLMIESPDTYHAILLADEWANTTEEVRGLALLGMDADGPGSHLELLGLHSGISPAKAPDLPPEVALTLVQSSIEIKGDLANLVRIYDPDRSLETLRRDA